MLSSSVTYYSVLGIASIIIAYFVIELMSLINENKKMMIKAKKNMKNAKQNMKKTDKNIKKQNKEIKNTMYLVSENMKTNRNYDKIAPNNSETSFSSLGFMKDSESTHDSISISESDFNHRLNNTSEIEISDISLSEKPIDLILLNSR